MAKQLAERFRVGASFTCVSRMLEEAGPDVVHITTPPPSHFEVAKQCLEGGANVYVEKPFTLNTTEAEELIRFADRQRLKLTVGHNAQFTHAMARMRALAGAGYLGGKPVHMESIYCYELADERYAKAFLGDKGHWVRTLPGSLLQNIISHGVSKIAEFLITDNPTVMACGFTSPFLKKIGEDDIVDEVRVIVKDEDATTAYFTFSSQLRPSLHQFRIYGPTNSLIVDDDHQVVIKLDGSDYKSYARYFVPPFEYAAQYLGSVGRNIGKFAKNDFHMPFEAGMRSLVESFYSSILDDAPLPLSYREILCTSRIMDEIFVQVSARS